MINKDINRLKLSVQKRVTLVSVLLLIGKFCAYFMTNSVGILTDAMESIVNVIAGIVTIYSIYLALMPKDKNHPYGHGKVELLSASTEGFLIGLAGLMIIYEAVKRLFVPAEIQKLDIGIIIIAVSGLINYLVGAYSIRVGKKHNSIALVAGGKHLQSDTYSTIGLVIGLILLMITKIPWLDSAIAIIFGGIIIFTGAKILKETTSNLMDEADFETIEKINDIFWNYKTENWIDIHNLKLIKYGDIHHIDCDLTIPWYLNVIEAHAEIDHMKTIVTAHYAEEVDLTIHTDACNETLCSSCVKKDCQYRSKPFSDGTKWTVESITTGKLAEKMARAARLTAES
jgi:cation diffusion facilitator family transporter